MKIFFFFRFCFLTLCKINAISEPFLKQQIYRKPRDFFPKCFWKKIPNGDSVSNFETEIYVVLVWVGGNLSRHIASLKSLHSWGLFFGGGVSAGVESVLSGGNIGMHMCFTYFWFNGTSTMLFPSIGAQLFRLFQAASFFFLVCFVLLITVFFISTCLCFCLVVILSSLFVFSFFLKLIDKKITIHAII